MLGHCCPTQMSQEVTGQLACRGKVPRFPFDSDIEGLHAL